MGAAPDPHRLFSAAAIGQTAAALLWPLQAALIAWAIGGVAQGAPLSATAGAALGVAALGGVRGGLEAAASRLAFRRARAALSTARAAAAAALAAVSPIDARRPASGFAASVLTEQAEAVVPYLARFNPARVKAAVVPLAIVAVILPFSWAAALALLIAAPTIPVFMALIGWRAKAASEKQLQAMGGVNGFLLDRLRGLATIRALGATALTAQRLRREAETVRTNAMAVLRIAFLSSATLELFAALGVALTAGYVGLHLLGEIDFGAWGRRLSLTEGVFVLLIAPAVFEPLRELAAVWHDRAAGQAALEALAALARDTAKLPEAASPPADPSPTALPAGPAGSPAWPSGGPPAVQLRELVFTHAGAAAPTLTGLDLDVAAGARVALFCRSGGGKSTILSLIAGLATAQRGEILIGGAPLDRHSAAALRARVAWIGQKPHFFAGSLRANVALGRPEIDGRAAARALAACGLVEDAADFGRRQVGENGAGLSGGEAVRLALSRAAADPARDLVLADEPTAHLDRAAAQKITQALLALSVGRTLIVATHDPVLAARMDRVVALDRLLLKAAS